MGNLKETARDRALERQRAKLADPAWRAEQYEKKRQSALRSQTRLKAKQATPEYKATQREKQLACIERSRKKNAEKPRKSTRGLKGRTPTADEKKIMDALGKLPCIACWVHGEIQPVISLHHIDGRTAPDAHKRQLPLCCWHHQIAAPTEIRKAYPWLVPVHADGKIGGRAEFEKMNDTEENLLKQAYGLISDTKSKHFIDLMN